ncbi:MAG: DUF1549 and DUF1553 domain-containing protein [Verrucomicrobiales bacterium]
MGFAAESRWAFSPPRQPPLPSVNESRWPKTPLDRFILTRIEASRTHPAPAAGKRPLIRRAYFDLIGLPPPPRDVEAFIDDASADAFAKIVDRLLASPLYGERWARHWLDVVRYTDSFDARILTGDGSVMDCTEAWRYRDWVVKAFNDDMPYDEFLRKQVAGDLMGDVVATGAFAIGNWGGGDADKEKLLTDIADDQVDLTGRAFLGVTLACARCHDHKFDPFSTRDYYALAGIFFSSHILANPGPKTNGPPMLRIPLASPVELASRAAAQKRIGEIDAALGDTVRPLADLKRDIHTKPGLHAWTGGGRDNPAVVINTTAAEISFLSIRLPARAVSFHPGPKTPVSLSWRAPVEGSAEVTVQLADADPTCGNGIGWELRHGADVIRKGEMDNAGQATIEVPSTPLKSGSLLQLVISPRGDYSCDSTRVEMTVRAGERTWNFTEAVQSDLQSANHDPWWICEGAGAIGGQSPELQKLEMERRQLVASMTTPLPMCHGLQEGGCPDSPHAGVHNVRLHNRGRYDTLGEEVERTFPVVLTHAPPPKIKEGSGRRELAQWLSHPQNPLAARVIVNRVWQHHFGEGIVRTPNNFGKLGEAPTHPELLDWLAVEFVNSGWSLKRLHRLILESATWQQASIPEIAMLKADPENRLLARQNRRRLESEAIRDSMLSAAGGLDFTCGGPAVRDFSAPRRTLYLLTIRSDRSNYQSLFDASDPTSISEKRLDSTVAPQALFLLNHPFSQTQAKALTVRLQREAPPDPAGRVEWLYQLLFARTPSAEEAALAETLLAGGDVSGWERYCQTLFCSNEFVYLD